MAKRSSCKRIREDEEATAHVFQDFLTSFQEVSTTPSKVFIKSGVLNPDKENNSGATKSQIYLPKPILPTQGAVSQSAIECARLIKESKLEKSKNKSKPRSNLELLKEEMKQRQLYKEEISVISSNYVEGNDPKSTNLFIANLNPKITEEELMLMFGKYGALASVKILWPRANDKFRYCNCGFVAFMSRKDAERALNVLKHREDMRIGWGKAVEIPPQPIYVPPEFIKLYLPPPYSGLPFNAQPLDSNYKKPNNYNEMDELLTKSVIKVTIPLDRRMLCIINRTVEYVVREGPLFEAMIMNNEGNNPDYSFMFDYKSALHVYYRWKIYSILNGDGQKSWNPKPFRMFKDGPIWIPPVPINYSNGMPDQLVETKDKNQNSTLSETQLNRLMDFIKNLTTSKSKISNAMVFCITHSCALDEIFGIIADSLKNPNTKPIKKIARLYLVSDIFANCKQKHISIKHFESEELLNIFKHLGNILNNLNPPDDQQFKIRVYKVLRCWSNRRVFSSEFLLKIEASFKVFDENSSPNHSAINDDDDSSNDEPLDGASLLKRSLKNESNVEVNIDDRFVPTTWNRVDPKDLEAQAMSTQKLYEMEVERKATDSKKKRANVLPTIVTSKWDDSD